MGTQKVQPEIGTELQRERDRRATRNRRLGALAVMAVVVAGAIVFVTTHSEKKAAPPALSSPSRIAPTPPDAVVPVIARLGGVNGIDVPGVPSDAIMLNLSPDGSQIAFVTWDIDMRGVCGGCPDRSRVAIIGTDGQGAHFLANPGPTTSVKMPTWSPDSSRLAFVMENHIYVMDADGTNMQRITDGVQDEFPVWSPDGSTIAYDSSGSAPFDDSGLSPTQEIWTVPSQGGTPVRVTRNHVPDQAPTFSPEGKTIAFFHDGRIAVVSVNGGAIRRLPGDPEGWTPRWSPDGTKIAFLDFRGDRADVPSLLNPAVSESLPLGTVEILDVTSGHVVDLGVETPSSYSAVSWTPQGDGVLVNAFTPTS